MVVQRLRGKNTLTPSVLTCFENSPTEINKRKCKTLGQSVLYSLKESKLEFSNSDINLV